MQFQECNFATKGLHSSCSFVKFGNFSEQLFYVEHLWKNDADT